ncbi:hypothetical protein PanWU01x14_349730 [Parasponia andersonii]|uniref:Uncharacterized protein n=1 Tax=Parasponia andersonii TaxID=3476 RepID=A0A2P5AB92_PARAD|nr:hypothetical protein PanWU01x14_349730 [Parasponia andersonii]
MATTESNGNDDRQGCCTLWLQKMVSLCSLGSSESGQNDDDDDNDHVSTDQTEEYDGYYYDHIEVHRLDKARALQLAARTSRLLVDFLFLISEQGGVVKVLGQFAAALESESREQENLEVVTKMLALLETAEKELRNTMTDQSRELKAVLTPDHGDESLVFDGLVDKFCEQIPRLEAFLMRQCAAESLMSTECVLEEMIGILDQCEAGLDAIEREIACEYAKTTTNPDDHESDYDQILKRDMVLKAKEIWCVVE